MQNIRPHARLPQAASNATLAARARFFSSQFSLWVAMLVCIGLLVAGKVFPESAHYWQSLLAERATPMLSITRIPAQWGAERWGGVKSWLYTYDENAKLRTRLESLTLAQSTLAELQQENKALRTQLSLPVAPGGHRVAAPVLAQFSDAFQQSFTIGAGTQQGIKKDQAVMSAEGLVGRVIEVQDNSALVLLLTDINSRIPVIGQTSRQRGILAGQNSEWLELNYAHAPHNFESGEIIVTSGDGKTLPQGLPIGRMQTTESGKLRVKPNASFDRLDWVSVVDYEWQHEAMPPAPAE